MDPCTSVRRVTRKVGVVQMTSTADVERNLSTVARCIADAASDGAELVVLPECFAYLGPEAGKLAIAESLPDGGPVLGRMRRLAIKHGVELVLGGFWEVSPVEGKVHNTCVHLDAGGQVRAAYRKIHLFDVDLPDGTRLEESATVEPGSEAVVTETVFGRLGLSVCYDLRFPELYRELTDLGAIALAIPAAFTLTTGKDHWHVLLRARAIEAQSYVLAAAQFGHHFGSRRSYGHALIADPWGVVLAEHGAGEGAVVARIDPAYVTEVRAGLPSLKHRRR
ncbi:MAG TPA: carbon-nitrogen hydrolase family protein [Polyangiaceae bacterium]|nr:carbon-nitrogen hydrolase family protein [Polyangiaceae bacterium]